MVLFDLLNLLAKLRVLDSQLGLLFALLFHEHLLFEDLLVLLALLPCGERSGKPGLVGANYYLL